MRYVVILNEDINRITWMRQLSHMVKIVVELYQAVLEMYTKIYTD
jgi:hypothetical protein